MGRAHTTGCYAHLVEQRRALPSGGPPGVRRAIYIGGPIEAAETASSLVKRTAVFSLPIVPLAATAARAPLRDVASFVARCRAFAWPLTRRSLAREGRLSGRACS